MEFPDHTKQIINNQLIAVTLLTEAIILLALWLYSEDLARLVTVICVVVPLGVLTVSLLSELFERSNITKKYFLFILALILLPLMMWSVFYFANRG
jgi:hypothetical protein